MVLIIVLNYAPHRLIKVVLSVNMVDVIFAFIFSVQSMWPYSNWPENRVSLPTAIETYPFPTSFSIILFTGPMWLVLFDGVK